jgi:hypothetical protein
MAKPVAQIMFDPAEDSDAIRHAGDAHQRKLQEGRGGIEPPIKRSCSASTPATSLTLHSWISHSQRPVRIGVIIGPSPPPKTMSKTWRERRAGSGQSRAF